MPISGTTATCTALYAHGFVAVEYATDGAQL